MISFVHCPFFWSTKTVHWVENSAFLLFLFQPRHYFVWKEWWQQRKRSGLRVVWSLVLALSLTCGGFPTCPLPFPAWGPLSSRWGICMRWSFSHSFIFQNGSFFVFFVPGTVLRGEVLEVSEKWLQFLPWQNFPNKHTNDSKIPVMILATEGIM